MLSAVTSILILSLVSCEAYQRQSQSQSAPQPLLPALARLTVALPLASPTPFPLAPRLLNMGAFLSMSGTMKKRTWLPRM